MPKAIELTGLRFGRWTVQERAGTRVYPSGARQPQYLCVCDCGKTKIVVASILRDGSSQSCGCWNAERRRKLCIERNTTHGQCGTPEYETWQSMLARCHSPNASGYKKYGAKGISVCKAWRESFETFLHDMGKKPFADASIERENPFGNYEPLNCRWIHLFEQQNNKRNSSISTLEDLQRLIRNYCEAKNLSIKELFETLA